MLDQIGNGIRKAINAIPRGKIRTPSRARSADAWLRKRLRDGGKESVSHAVAFRLIAQKVKKFILLDGPANCHPVLLERDRPLGRGGSIKIVARVPCTIASECICRSVNTIRAGFYPDSDNRSRLPAVFRR